jgi:phosphoglycolate phosphatase
MATATPPPKAILFDWDNTLVDSWVAIHHALEVTFTEMGHKPWTLEEVRQRVRASARDAFPEIFGGRADEASALFYEVFARDHLARLTAREGAELALRELWDLKLYLGVVSNKTGTYLRAEAEALGWSPLFGRIVGATDAPRDKPAPDPVHMALSQAGVPAGPDVWFVGDTDIDMLCASRSGCFAVLLRPEAPEAGEFDGAEPHAHVEDFEALRALVRHSLG